MLYQALMTAWRDQPQRIVLFQSGGNDWSVAKLREVVMQYAACLNAHRVKPGDRVLVQIEKSAYAVALYLACLRQGVVFVPMNTACTLAELDYFIADADPVLVIKDTLLDAARSHASATSDDCSSDAVVVTLDATGSGSFATEDAQDVSPYKAQADTPAAMVYTLGTTGRSKGAVLTNLNLLSNAQALVEVWEFSEQDVLLHALPVFHVHGLFIALHTALLSGAALIFLPQTFREFEQRTGHRIVERYGMSETNVLCSNPLHGDRVPGTVGFPLPGVVLRIADDNDQTVAAGEHGAIQVRGDNVLHAYWRREGLQQQEFTADGYFRTGDVGCRSQNGRVTLTGRAKDLIISGGLNVYPAEIERALDAQKGVLESAVVGIAHPDYGEQVIAYAVPEARETLTSEEAAAELITQLHTAARCELANYKRPKQFHLLEALPRNTMGKVQKNRLREHAERAVELD